MKSKSKKTKLPRGQYRQKWDMPHKSKKDYDRKTEKEEIEENILSSENISSGSSNLLEIECSFQKIKEHSCLLSSEDDKMRLGRYHGSCFGFGNNTYPIVAYINFDYNKCVSQGLTEEVMFDGCISFLNRKKKYQRKSPYGKLIPRQFNIKKEKEKTYFVALLTTDQRKLKCFWGEGRK